MTGKLLSGAMATVETVDVAARGDDFTCHTRHGGFDKAGTVAPVAYAA
jgi:hypothetical protein